MHVAYVGLADDVNYVLKKGLETLVRKHELSLMALVFMGRLQEFHDAIDFYGSRAKEKKELYDVEGHGTAAQFDL